MITLGFAFGFSDVVTLDSYFYKNDDTDQLSPLRTTCIYIGTPGDLVYENSAGQAQWFPNAPIGFVYLSAQRILTSATVRGSSRTTTAANIVWCASGQY